MLEMTGCLCASILKRASRCTSTLSSIALLQPQPVHQCHFSSCGASRSQSDWLSIFSNESGDSSQSGPYLLICQDQDLPLSQVEIDSVLRSNEQTMTVPDGRVFSVVRKFESNQVAANTPIEDRRNAATCLRSKGKFFGVYDGHGGWSCAQTISERLLYYTAVAMMSKQSLEELERCVKHGKAVPPILQWYKHHADFKYRGSASLFNDHLRVFWQDLLSNGEHGEGMSPLDALDHSFQRLDADISLEAQAPLSNDLKSMAIQTAFSGSTACVAHVDTDGIHVANVGDSRAVLGVLKEDGSWSALPLSKDHNAHNQAEMRRIKAEHPPSERNTVVTWDRLLGVLMPLRAFGDVRFKWSLELQRRVLASVDLNSLNLRTYTPRNYLTPPYLSVAPEITYHKLRPQDCFLILGTDGLWDKLENEEAVRLVGEHLSRNHQQAPVSPPKKWKEPSPSQNVLDTNAATHLIRHALGTGENGELCQERLASILSLPTDMTRMHRDDITVIVVYLNVDKPDKCAHI